MRRAGLVVVLAALVAAGCEHKQPPHQKHTSAATSVGSVAEAPGPAVPQLLYLPDGGDIAPPAAPGHELLPGPWGASPSRCPPDMVDIQGRFCIDRYEDSLVDRQSGRTLSPYYHPTSSQARASYRRWQRKRLTEGPPSARDMPVPPPPDWEIDGHFMPEAVSRRDVLPNGYLDQKLARQACEAAGKRLCTPAEWVTACRGEQNRQFPYGDSYRQGACNVYRASHPALILHGNASIGHLDPRLNEVKFHGDPLLRKTGQTPECRSKWGDDAVYDMVGNLDEWVDDPDGAFLGGFYSRGTRAGCESRISTHPPQYFDYSLGVRCCK